MRGIEDSIKETKDKLFDKWGIKTDRDLFKQLNLSEEDKEKYFGFQKLQMLYSLEEGYKYGVTEIKDELREIINKILK